MKTIKFFCDAFLVLFLAVITIGYLAVLEVKGEPSGGQWKTLEDIMKKKFFITGYTLSMDIFIQNNKLCPCAERNIKKVVFPLNDSFRGARLHEAGTLIRVFENEELLKRSLSMDRKFKPPYWDEGVVALIEFEEDLVRLENGRLKTETKILRAEKKEKDKIINILSDTLDMSPK